MKKDTQFLRIQHKHKRLFSLLFYPPIFESNCNWDNTFPSILNAIQFIGRIANGSLQPSSCHTKMSCLFSIWTCLIWYISSPFFYSTIQRSSFFPHTQSLVSRVTLYWYCFIYFTRNKKMISRLAKHTRFVLRIRLSFSASNGKYWRMIAWNSVCVFGVINERRERRKWFQLCTFSSSLFLSLCKCQIMSFTSAMGYTLP